jgi:hypothetical protein
VTDPVFGSCINPPCYNTEQAVQAGVALLVGLALIGFGLLFITRLLGGEGVAQAGTAVLERLPRLWRDETFYEDLVASRSAIGRAALTVSVVGILWVAIDAIVMASEREVGGAMNRVALGIGTAFGFWLLSGSIAYLVARFFVTRRASWRKILTALGYAFAPLALVGLVSIPLGIPLMILGLTWAGFLAYLALRGRWPTIRCPRRA